MFEDNQSDIRSVKYTDNLYPRLLKYIKDPPEVLYYRGDLKLASEPSIAIVGSRKATAYGKWAAYELSKKLSYYQIAVVSGMAIGIDTYAHKGAIDHMGKTIAVLGCGADFCYPQSNRTLMNKILETGLIITEFEPGTKPMPYRFPLRNRIISGLTLGTVVVEAGLNSGSLITAERAAEQGRNIYAVPGNINSVYSVGSNKLIKDGAIPVTALDDIIDELGVTRKPTPERQREILGADEKKIYDIIQASGEITTDGICKVTGRFPADVNAIVSILEIKGLVHTAFGKIFIAK